MWTHLERQKGGIGMRGPGETEIETDRRIVRDKISLLKSKIKTIDKQMSVQRGNRGKLIRVALVGYTNVGKSTLVNRIIGRREAIVEERPGVTRDRNEFDVTWAGCEFTLIDTGGWLPKSKSEKGIDDKVSKQSELAINQADVTFLVVDARVTPTVEDALIADMLRNREKPTFLAANKVDDQNHEVGMWEYLSMGLGEHGMAAPFTSSDPSDHKMCPACVKQSFS